MSIIDTLPPVEDRSLYDVTGNVLDLNTLLLNVNDLRQRDRAIVEHVVRMCAAELRGRANRISGPWAHAMNDGADRILALLEPKP